MAFYKVRNLHKAIGQYRHCAGVVERAEVFLATLSLRTHAALPVVTVQMFRQPLLKQIPVAIIVL